MGSGIRKEDKVAESILSKAQYHLAIDLAKQISESASSNDEIRRILIALRKLLEVNSQVSLEIPL